MSLRVQVSYDMRRPANRRVPGVPGHRPHRAVVNAVLAGLAANVGVYAGWTQSSELRIVCAVTFLLLTSATVVSSVGPRTARPPGGSSARTRRPRLRPHVPKWLSSKADVPFFRGREKELRELQERHRQRRGSPSGSHGASGPLVLAIHGRPGVGKTALAQQLALRLAESYPHGQLYQNMGTGGVPRPPRDILHSLLRKLDWPEEEMRGMSAAELGGVFRANTADKQMLIVLDAARSLEQITAVLPGGSGCTVITTSRANLLAGRGQHSQRLGPVTAGDAAEILLGSLGMNLTTKPDLVAEVIELCDFQPNALLSAADRARNESLDQTLRRLRPPENRLDVLRYGGRDVAERIASEYNNLEAPEKTAFLLLTVPESETFVPWALQSLLDIGSTEAGNLMARISKVGLLELEGRDPSGFGRYRFSSLVRLFAEQRLRDGDVVSPAEADEARGRFRYAYLAGAVRVLGQLGVTGVPDLPTPVPDHRYPEVSGWEGMVADNLEAWIRAEFGSLIRAVQDAAAHGQSALCWQIAARLGDCFSPPAQHADVRRAFDMALTAARGSAGSPAAVIQVRLARSGYLAAVHDYSNAITELNDVVTLATNLNDQALKAEALRRLAHAWQEIADYDHALTELKEGQSVAIHANHLESRLIELLRGENDAIRDPNRWTAKPSPDGLSRDHRDNSQFTEKIILGRAARRRRECPACDHLLKEAQRYSTENLAHCLDIQHEQATTWLHCTSWSVPASSLNGHDARSVISLAAQAVRSADRLDRPHARAQARCTLAHALVRAGRTDDCLVQLEFAEQIVQTLPSDEAERLNVYIQRVRGEALLRSHRALEAQAALEPAERWLAQRECWAHAELLLLLGAAHRELHQFSAALSAHATAVEAFRQHHDKIATDLALTELSTTLRASGAGPFSAWRLRRALTQGL